MSGWRVWQAFEARPGISIISTQDKTEHWRGLADQCRKSDGQIDPDELNYWLGVIVGHSHLWGNA